MSHANVNLQHIPIDQVVPNEWNPNVQTDFVFEKEINSIKKFGFVAPILVREKGELYEIVDGEHRWRAAKESGMTEIPVNNLGNLDEAAALQLTVVMNETRGTADRHKLSALLKDLHTVHHIPMEEILHVMPYTEVDVQTMVAENEVDWEFVQPQAASGQGSEAGVYGENDEWKTLTYRLPEGVADQWEQQIERFKRALHPDEKDLSQVSYVMSLECMIQHLAQLPDGSLTGE